MKDVKLFESRHRVVQIDQLRSAIKKDMKQNLNALGEDEINSLYLRLLPLTMVSVEQKMKHVEDVRRKAGRGYQKIY